jgi:hypothetical protein
MVYSGLVPMSPNTTPSAPRIKADLAPWPLSVPLEAGAWSCTCSLMEILTA